MHARRSGVEGANGAAVSLQFGTQIAVDPDRPLIERQNLKRRKKHFKRLPIPHRATLGHTVCKFAGHHTRDANITKAITLKVCQNTRRLRVNDVDANVCIEQNNAEMSGRN